MPVNSERCRAKLAKLGGAIADLDLNNPTAVQQFLRKARSPSLWDYVTELWINSILAGPKSWIINEVGNIATALKALPERAVAAGIEQGMAPLQHRPPERFFSEVSAEAFGAISGIKEGLQAGLYTLKNGFSLEQASKYEFARTAFPGTFGRVVRMPTTIMEAADTMNYAINYRGALATLGVRQVKKEGLRGEKALERMADLKLDPPEEMIKQASDIANYRLFRNDPGVVANTLISLREKYPPFRFVVPFIRTPVNLVKYGLARSPVGLVNPSLWRHIAQGNPEASDQLARVFLGSVMAAGIAWKFHEGKITGAVPKNPAERDRFYREGKVPYAVRIGDAWVQYQRLEPFNQPIAQVAVAIEAMKANDKDAGERAARAVSTLAQNLTSQTYASGIMSLLQLTSDVGQYGPKWAGHLASGFVPQSGALRTVAQTIDPVFRRPTNFGESLMSGLPGLSKNVPPITTAFGEQAQREFPGMTGAAAGATSAIFPIRINPAHQTLVDNELEKVRYEVSFVGSSINNMDLNTEQKQRYQEIAGQETYNQLNSLFQSPTYQNIATRDAKKNAIQGVIEKARKQAREMLRREFPEIPEPAQRGGGGIPGQ